MSEAPLRLENVTRTFAQGTSELEVFHDLNLTLSAGELVGLVGQSGAGKSSLLHIAGLLEAPTRGEVFIDGQAVSTLPDSERTRIRRDEIGFVYQAHHLLAEFTALENVVLPQRIAGRSRPQSEADASHILSHLGLGLRLQHRPTQMSGGEQQRVAIARALANRPKILLADEPTGNLDPRTAKAVFDSLIELVRSKDLSVLVATHNLELARRMDRVLILEDGQLVAHDVSVSV